MTFGEIWIVERGLCSRPFDFSRASATALVCSAKEAKRLSAPVGEDGLAKAPLREGTAPEVALSRGSGSLGLALAVATSELPTGSDTTGFGTSLAGEGSELLNNFSFVLDSFPPR